MNGGNFVSVFMVKAVTIPEKQDQWMCYRDLAYAIVGASFCKAVSASDTVRKGRSQVGWCPQLELKSYNSELKRVSLAFDLGFKGILQGPFVTELRTQTWLRRNQRKVEQMQAQVLLYANKVNKQISNNMCELPNGTASFPPSKAHRHLSCDSEMYNKGDYGNCD